MKSLDKIKKISTTFHLIIKFFLILIPIYYLGFWIFINDIPSSLIQPQPYLGSFLKNELTINLKILGFASSILPMLSLIYIFINLKRLFNFYKNGDIFSFEHVEVFKKMAKGLLFWVFFSIVYEGSKSIIFSFTNPPGSRVVAISFGSMELTFILGAVIVLIISWVMDEGRILLNENRLTI